MTLTIPLNQDTGVNALNIPKLTHAEAGHMSQYEYERVLELLEQLSGDDWSQPTYCTEWNVQQMVAHLAGACAGSCSFAEFKRQNVTNPLMKQYDEPIDATNALQLQDRVGMSPAELVEEFRQAGQLAVEKRQQLPWLIRNIHLPMGPLGITSIQYLMDTLYPRDQWMHRYDISAATGKEMVITPEHDKRVVDLVISDLAGKLRRKIGKRSLRLHLTGAITATYNFGHDPEPQCEITLDVFIFNLLASGRISIEEAKQQASVSGDIAVAEWFLQHTEVIY